LPKIARNAQANEHNCIATIVDDIVIVILVSVATRMHTAKTGTNATRLSQASRSNFKCPAMIVVVQHREVNEVRDNDKLRKTARNDCQPTALWMMK